MAKRKRKGLLRSFLGFLFDYGTPPKKSRSGRNRSSTRDPSRWPMGYRTEAARKAREKEQKEKGQRNLDRHIEQSAKRAERERSRFNAFRLGEADKPRSARRATSRPASGPVQWEDL